MLAAAAVSWMTQGSSNVNSLLRYDGELQCNYRKRRS